MHRQSRVFLLPRYNSTNAIYMLNVKSQDTVLLKADLNVPIRKMAKWCGLPLSSAFEVGSFSY